MKRIDKDINIIFYGYIVKPFRTRKELIALLLETTKLLYTEGISGKSYGKVIVVIDKMSRVFYEIENKIFSMVFPFGIEKVDGRYRVYDVELEVDIDSKLLSIMISILAQLELLNVTAESILDVYCDTFSEEIEREDVKAAWEVLFKLLFIELGYIRYDLDEEHADMIYHPLNHFDVNYSADTSYKIGLRKAISVDYMISFLDTKSKCSYLELEKS